MILLSAIPQKWDHITATSLAAGIEVEALEYTQIRACIIAEWEQHQADKPSGSTAYAQKATVIKKKGPTEPQHKGKQPQAPQPPTNSNAGPSTFIKQSDGCLCPKGQKHTCGKKQTRR